MAVLSFRRGKRAKQTVGRPKTGMRFRCRNAAGRGNEIALVKDVSLDGMGIWHVRYTLFLERASMPLREMGPRTMNLESFKERYRELLADPGNAEAAE